jgi:hypothetical protein
MVAKSSALSLSLPSIRSTMRLPDNRDHSIESMENPVDDGIVGRGNVTFDQL